MTISPHSHFASEYSGLETTFDDQPFISGQYAEYLNKFIFIRKYCLDKYKNVRKTKWRQLWSLEDLMQFEMLVVTA